MKLHLPIILRNAVLACYPLVACCTLYSGSMVTAADLTLGNKDSLSVDYAEPDSITNLMGGSLQLIGDTQLNLSNCGEGDGKLYTLFTGISQLTDKDGNILSAGNYSVADYFNTNLPGTGFWANATLQLTQDGTLQLVRHNEQVKSPLDVTSRQTSNLEYQYHESASFHDISIDSDGGAIYGGESGSTIMLNNNGNVEFRGNKAYNGGAIYGASNSMITLFNNGSVVFSRNSGRAICVVNGTSIMLNLNNNVEFSENSGGAYYGDHDTTITLSNNNSVVFSGNSGSGAIHGDRDTTITLSNNNRVEFSENKASRGGAIYGDSYSTITLSDNSSMVFSKNTVTQRNSYSSGGGAIYGGYNSTITLSNNGDVVFDKNSALYSTYSFSSCGGAIYGNTITLSNNKNLFFDGNYISSGYDYKSLGGAIYGSTITLNDNGSVTFSGNTASSYFVYDSRGGAIYGTGNLNIRNNESVLFEKNVEKSDTDYHLRSIYAGVNGDTISLSAAEGKSIEFRDSVYLDYESTVNFNADYTDEEGEVHQQTGDIIFTGKYTETHLNEILAADGAERTATTEELRDSRTSEVNAETKLYGGRLRVEDGAIYKGYGITAMEGSCSTVLVKNAELRHGNYNLTFNDGTTLELHGKTSISGNVRMLEGSTLIIDMESTMPESSPHITGGVFEVLGDVLISGTVDLSSLNSNSYEYIIGDGTYTWNPERVETSFSSIISDEVIGISEKISVNSSGKLVFGVRSTENVTWVNATGDGRWNNCSANWVDGDYRFAYVQGTNVTLSKIGEGIVTLDGEIGIGNMKVEAGSSYELLLNESSTLQMKGSLNIGHGAHLTLGSDIAVKELDNQGDLVVGGDLTVSGEITGAGELSAVSLSSESLNASSLRLSDEEANNRINGTVTVQGSVDIAGNLIAGGAMSGTSVTVGGSLVVASLTAESLSAASLRLTDAETHSTVTSVVDVDGVVDIAGRLTAGTISAGSISAVSLTLTTVGAVNTVHGEVKINGDIVSSGNLIAGSISADNVSATSLTLTTVGAENTVDGDMKVSGDIVSAGSLITGSLSADSVTATKLNLTTVNAENTVGGDVTISGDIVSAGRLNIGSIAAGSISTTSLSLTTVNAVNTVGGDITVSGDIVSAGNLSSGGVIRADSVQVDGALTGTTVEINRHLQAGAMTADSISADSLSLTTAGAVNTVHEEVKVSGDIFSAGNLCVGGGVRADSVQIAGEMTGTTVEVNQLLQAGAMTADSVRSASLSLTTAGAVNTVHGEVKVSGDIFSAGNLCVGGGVRADSVQIAGEMTGTTVEVNQLLQAGAMTADSVRSASLSLTTAGAVNTVHGEVKVSGDIFSAGNLCVGGGVRADSVQIAGEMTGTTVEVNQLLQAGAMTADSVSSASLSLTTAGADSTVLGEVKVSGDIVSAGNLSTGSLFAANVNTDTLALTSDGTTNTVSGNLAANCVSLATGAELAVGGTLTANEVQMTGRVKTLTAGAFGAESMNFVLDRAALETLNLGYGESSSIAQADEAIGRDFTATLNGNIKPVQAAAYTYSISVSGGDVKLTADYAHDGLQVWYRGAWVGQSGWTDYYVAGYDAVAGVETIDLAGETVEGDNLYIAYENGANHTVLTNGVLEFGYVDMGGGQFELGKDAEVITDELYGKGETLKMYDGSVLDTSDLTLGTLDMQGGEVTVKTATIGALSGSEGTLNIARRGDVKINSDVTLTGLDNEGILDLDDHILTVNALVKNGGNVIAGEVKVQCSGSRMASFDELVADKVTVENTIQTGRYTDDLSVGDGSAIGELVAETLEVREGTVMLGRNSGSTNINLQNLDLQQDATLELNQATKLTVTNELTATEQAIVKLNNGAGISYGDFSVTNRGVTAPTEVDAYKLSEGELPSLSNAHVTVNSSGDTTITAQLSNSAVQNVGTGTLTVNHGENSLTDIYATGGDIVVMNTANLNLQELEVAAGMSLSAYVENVASADYEAKVSVSSKATLGLGATLNADLVIESGATLDLGGAVDMGSDLYLNSGTTLGGSLLTVLRTAEIGSRIDLFTGIDSLYFNGVKQDSLTLSDGISAEQYFSNLTDELNRYYYLTFDDSLAGDGVLSIEVSNIMVPEPTTVTLSLLALAGLAARRRRK
ncbi:MAG: PEP-CTERM sorting domain-containing protein [Akkermansia sp.]|nr:PEP-CTERM sorting domain-containing protein [Akkermansia sp.]